MSDKKEELDTLCPGTKVKIEGLRNVGEIIDGPDSKGQFQVAIGNFTMLVPNTKLSIFADKKKKKSKPVKRVSHASFHESSKSPLEIDLHGLTVEQALAAVENAIDKAILTGTDQLNIIHGKGSGILRHAIHKYLQNSTHVRNFSLDDLNQGTTRVFL